MLALEWTDSETESKAVLDVLSDGDLSLCVEQVFDELMLECPWHWGIQVPYDGGQCVVAVTEGDCGAIRSRVAAKVHAERCAREYFEGLARKLLAR